MTTVGAIIARCYRIPQRSNSPKPQPTGILNSEGVYMKKVYLDMSESPGCIGAIAGEDEVIPAGATVNAMSIRNKNTEY